MLQLRRSKVGVSSAAERGVPIRVIPLLRRSLGKSRGVRRRGTTLLVSRDSPLRSRRCAVRGLRLRNVR